MLETRHNVVSDDLSSMPPTDGTQCPTLGVYTCAQGVVCDTSSLVYVKNTNGYTVMCKEGSLITENVRCLRAIQLRNSRIRIEFGTNHAGTDRFIDAGSVCQSRFLRVFVLYLGIFSQHAILN